MPKPTRKPWERQVSRGKEEPAPAYRAFCVYRDLGPDRSLILTAQRIAATGSANRATEGLQKSAVVHVPGRINLWCRQWKWVDRANAWDDEVDRIARKAKQKEILDSRKRQVELARAGSAVVSVIESSFLRLANQDPNFLQTAKGQKMAWLALAAGRTTRSVQQAERKALLGGAGDFPAEEAVGGDEAEEFEAEWPNASKPTKTGRKS